MYTCRYSIQNKVHSITYFICLIRVSLITALQYCACDINFKWIQNNFNAELSQCPFHFLFYFVDPRSTPLKRLHFLSLFPCPPVFLHTCLQFCISHTQASLSPAHPQIAGPAYNATNAVTPWILPFLFYLWCRPSLTYAHTSLPGSRATGRSPSNRSHAALAQIRPAASGFQLNKPRWTAPCPLSVVLVGAAHTDQHRNFSPISN